VVAEGVGFGSGHPLADPYYPGMDLVYPLTPVAIVALAVIVVIDWPQ
jgi:hypothetical protein